jgi:hypothetical protein
LALPASVLSFIHSDHRTELHTPHVCFIKHQTHKWWTKTPTTCLLPPRPT